MLLGPIFRLSLSLSLRKLFRDVERSQNDDPRPASCVASRPRPFFALVRPGAQKTCRSSPLHPLCPSIASPTWQTPLSSADLSGARPSRQSRASRLRACFPRWCLVFGVCRLVSPVSVVCITARCPASTFRPFRLRIDPASIILALDSFSSCSDSVSPTPSARHLACLPPGHPRLRCQSASRYLPADTGLGPSPTSTSTSPSRRLTYVHAIVHRSRPSISTPWVAGFI